MNISDKEKVSKRMKEIRKKKSLTQKQIAETMGISRSVYSRVEVNSYKPNLDHVHAFGKFFKVDLNWLVLGHKFNSNVASENGDDYILQGEDPEEKIQILQKMVETLEANIKDKDTIIAYQRKEIESLKEK